MNSTVLWFLWVLAAAVLGSIPILLIKQHVVTPRWPFYVIVIISVLLTIALLYVYLQLFQGDHKTKSVTTTNAMIRIASILFVMAVSMFFMSEHLTKYQWLGIGLAIVALVLLSIHR